MVRLTVSTPFHFRIVDVGRTKMTSPTSLTMEFTGIVWISLIVLKLKQYKGIKGYSSKHVWMVEEEPRKISLWIFKWLKIGLDALTVPFDTMYTIPICIWSYKDSANSLNANICISSCEALTRSNQNTFPCSRHLPSYTLFLVKLA